MGQILEIGEYVIVNGVIAVISELIGSENLKVREHESGLLYTVNVGDIRVIPKSSKQSENFRLDPTDPAMAQSLVQAAERAEVIMKYRRGELSVKQSGELLGIKKSQFYKLNKNYSEDFGPSSIVRQTAGPKSALPESASIYPISWTNALIHTTTGQQQVIQQFGDRSRRSASRKGCNAQVLEPLAD